METQKMMLNTTKEVVDVLETYGDYSVCLFKLKAMSKKGNMGHIQPVRTNKLVPIKSGYVGTD